MIQDLILSAFREDLPEGDVTTDSLGISDYPGYAKLIAKEDLVLSGKRLFTASVHHRDPSCQIKWYFEDGQWILKDQVVALIEGNLIELLKAERVALNFLGRLCGIDHCFFFIFTQIGCCFSGI